MAWSFLTATKNARLDAITTQAIPEQIRHKSLDIADIKPLTAQYDAIADQAMVK